MGWVKEIAKAIDQQSVLRSISHFSDDTINQAKGCGESAEKYAT